MTDQHIETVNHLKKKLDKGVSFEKTMHILYKLQKIPISVKLLEETGIGYKLRELSKQEKDNDVGKTAKLLIMAWKEMVKKQQQQEEEDEEEEEEDDDDDSESEQQRQRQRQRQQNRGDRQKPTQQQQQHHQQMDSEDDHELENGDEENEPDVTPRSDRSEESVSQNYHHHQHHHHHQHQHKKKHKKKKKKSKENNENSGDEQQQQKQQRIMDRKERKKDKKRKHHRDESNDHDDRASEQYRPESSSKRHKPNESSSSSSSSASSSAIINETKKPPRINFNNTEDKCDNHNEDKTYSNGDIQSDDDPQSAHQSRWSRNESTAGNHHRTYSSNNDDMFSAVLNMGDHLMASKNSSKTQVAANNNQGQGSSRSRSYNLNEESDSMTSSIDREIMQSLPPYSAGIDQIYSSMPRTTTSNNSYNFEIERQTAAMAGMKFKGRTQVFAGSSKIPTVPKVYKLQDICIKVLMNHVDKIYQVGDLPYFLLKPVFAKCTVQQLKRIESYNPQLLEDTDELWKEFCEKEFKVKQFDRRRFQSWRDYYDHLVEQREERLKNITRNINSKQRQAMPERKTQQIEHVKTPREIRRRQEKIVNATPYGGKIGGGGGGGSSGLKSMAALNNTVANKSKTGPLMKKLLQMRQSKFRR